MKGQKTLFSSASDEWTTPVELIWAIEDRWGRFALDAAATEENAVTYRWFTEEDDALTQEWTNSGLVWLNPPYSKIKAFVEKAIEEARKGARIILLLPARTDTKWFHQLAPEGTIYFLRGRLKFGGGKNSAPFPSMLVDLGGPGKGILTTWDWRKE